MNKERKPLEEYASESLPGARYFDIDAVSDTSSPLPHMLPSVEKFVEACNHLNISNDDHVLVYVHKGCFSAARVWWTFKVFNHDKVSIINGGLEAWKRQGGEVGPSVDISYPADSGAYVNKGMNANMVLSSKQVLDVVNTGSAQILDARSAARFKGEAPGINLCHL